MKAKKGITRRAFIGKSSAAAVGLTALPIIGCGRLGVSKPVTRDFGRLDFEVTTLGLGGQGSLQWTAEGVDPVKIILKAFNLGVNYFDTSNAYGPSQSNYGKALKELNLVPGMPGYDEKLRKSVFLTSKTMIKYGKGPFNEKGIWSWSDGGNSLRVADDIKRSVSELFGDGKGNYPEGAYVDMMMIHNIMDFNSIKAVYEGYDNPDPKDERIGALATLIDYRDGTNLTGLNPGEEKLIRHLGFSGHKSPELMLNMIQRDHRDVFDGMLVALNANDRLYFNMQHNVLPVTAAKNMGVIAMKVFSDGAMYSKDAFWSQEVEHLVHGVGSPELPSRLLVQYPLTTPGIHTAITGITDISDDESRCQLKQNFSAAQISTGDLSSGDRIEIEKITATVKNGETNYFQDPAVGLGPARNFRVEQISENGNRKALLKWDNAFAGREPLAYYEILRDDRKIKQVEYKPQTTLSPFEYTDPLSDTRDHSYRIITVDQSGAKAESEIMNLQAV
jgi:aryl-alcohol dehydrogenase-like predicted oxidoreductase